MAFTYKGLTAKLEKHTVTTEEVEKQLLLSAMNNLCEREKEIIKMRYGLCGKSEKTQKEVADEMGISQSYISRLEKKIINKISFIWKYYC